MQIDWITVGAQILNFLVLVWLLNMVLYRPVTRAMEGRADAIRERFAEAERREAEAARAAELSQAERLALEERRSELLEEAHEEARSALGAYWTALEGTLDPRKVEQASVNALIGNPVEVARQINERFHPADRLMLWFDFFNHDCDRVIRNMECFMREVAPLIEEKS